MTKLIAADLAIAAGCSTIITLGSTPQKIPLILSEIAAHQQSHPDTPFTPTMGTHFLAKKDARMVDRKWWILHGLAVSGTVYLDAGAVGAVSRVHRGSLFAVGVVRVEGSFGAQQCVRLVTIVKKKKSAEGGDEDGDEEEEQLVEIGRGISNYASSEIIRIRGHKSSEIEKLLGYVDSGCVIHRDNLVITNRGVDLESIVLKQRTPEGSLVDLGKVDGA